LKFGQTIQPKKIIFGMKTSIKKQNQTNKKSL
jgi:hypothetical protein